MTFLFSKIKLYFLLSTGDIGDFDREFDKIQDEKHQQRLSELATLRQEAEANVQFHRDNLKNAKDQVSQWQSRVEKTTIEKLRSFQKPSKTIIEVMEMVMTLIGKRSIMSVLAGRNDQSDASGQQRGSLSTFCLLSFL